MEGSHTPQRCSRDVVHEKNELAETFRIDDLIEDEPLLGRRKIILWTYLPYVAVADADLILPCEETFNVTLELVKRGYTEEQIGKLWSGNLLRVLDDVQAVAKQIQEAA